jgi:2,5-diamino-6-(ribosylamino)-4(3H)-pyrimidinone 5'-phosphate reductase
MNTRPFVRINMAMSADGKITSTLKEPARFTSAYDRHHMDVLRAQADALVVGAETVRIDNPFLHVRDAALYAQRNASGKPPLIKTIVTQSGNLPTSLRVFAEKNPGQTVVAVPSQAAATCHKFLGAYSDIWVCGETQVSALALLQRLHAVGVQHVLLEGGSMLNALFFQEHCVDEICLTLAPCVLGGAHAPTWVAGEGWPMAQRLPLKLLSVKQVEDEIYCQYQVLASHTQG